VAERLGRGLLVAAVRPAAHVGRGELGGGAAEERNNPRRQPPRTAIQPEDNETPNRRVWGWRAARPRFGRRRARPSIPRARGRASRDGSRSNACVHACVCV
jgi:hypothetical protein